MEPLKPFKTYKEQVDHLKNTHGLIIYDETRAEYILSSTNYYRLSAYGITLRDPVNSERYKPGSTFENIYRLYVFDNMLRTILFPLIEEVEIQFRTRVAYQLGKQYGPEGYMDVNNFLPKVNPDTGIDYHTDVITKFRSEVTRQNRLPCVAHHNNKYGGHFPVWAAIELFTFGMVSSLYSSMKRADQKAVAATFNTKPNYLNSWILSLVELRNICAHSNRIYFMKFKQTPALYPEHAKYGASYRLFPVLLVLKRLCIGRSQWNSFAAGLGTVMNSFSDVVDLSCLGFPPEWRTVLGVPVS